MTTLQSLFHNPNLFRASFVHRSYLNESREFKESNERLEYLGDAVLELAASEFLFKKYPHYQEGMLTNLRAALVRTESLAETASLLGFPSLLMISKGEEATGGRQNHSLLADTFEAFLGALYLDQGYAACQKFCATHLFPKITNIVQSKSYQDNKSRLQEVAQARFKTTPVYDLISDEGPDHNKLFRMVARLGNTTYGVGEGKSKQSAQEEAARLALEELVSA